MLKKYGDPMPITGAIEPKNGDEQAVCPQCNQPLVTFAFDEDDETQLVCQCDDPNIILPE